MPQKSSNRADQGKPKSSSGKSAASVRGSNGNKSATGQSSRAGDREPLRVEYLGDEGDPWKREDRLRIRYLGDWDKAVEASKSPKPIPKPPSKIRSE
jgi:hypothetical protein